MNSRDVFMLRIGAPTYTEAREMAAEFTGYDVIISHLREEGRFVAGMAIFSLRNGTIELSYRDG